MEYGDYGFNFTVTEENPMGFGNMIDVSFSHPLVNNGEEVKYSSTMSSGKREFDNTSESDDKITANAIMKWMIARVKEVEDVITKDRIGKEKITEWKP